MVSTKKKLLVIGTLVFSTTALWLAIQKYPSAFLAITSEIKLESTFPSNVDIEDVAQGASWLTLPFGYSLGPWPTRFLGNPIVMKMPYTKGPPEKFIQTMSQIWDPINAEVSFEGPRTAISGMSPTEWRSCYRSRLRCWPEKRKLYQLSLRDLERWKIRNWDLRWVESTDPKNPQGIWLHLENAEFHVDRFLFFTDQGVAQSFTLKSLNNPRGLEARDLFRRVMSGIKLKDDLSNARAWIKTRLQSIRLDQIQRILDPRLRLAKLIQAQTLLFSQLSVSPTQAEPFFHLAGTSHILAVALLKEKDPSFSGQDAWISHAEPQLRAILSYLSDFENSDPLIKNVEALLQDILLLQQRLSK